MRSARTLLEDDSNLDIDGIPVYKSSAFVTKAKTLKPPDSSSKKSKALPTNEIDLMDIIDSHQARQEELESQSVMMGDGIQMKSIEKISKDLEDDEIDDQKSDEDEVSDLDEDEMYYQEEEKENGDGEEEGEQEESEEDEDENKISNFGVHQ